MDVAGEDLLYYELINRASLADSLSALILAKENLCRTQTAKTSEPRKSPETPKPPVRDMDEKIGDQP
jgi:hypothetical protein